MRIEKKILINFLIFICVAGGLSAQSTCFDTGTLLYREDFKGNEVTDPAYPTTDVSGGYSDFPFYPGGGGGYYTLIKAFNDPVYWNNTDHTHFGDPTRGYYMFVNPSEGQMDAILYQKQIDGLCDGLEVLLSVWITNICKPGVYPPKFELVISDAVTDAILTQTGVITGSQWSTQEDWKWERYTTSVVVPPGTTSMKFTVINKENTTSGNDLGVDDIEIWLCTGPVSTAANGSGSSDITLTDDIQTVFFTGSYLNNAVFGTNLTSYWLYSTTGDITSFSDWVPLDKKSATVALNATHNHNFTLMNAKPGYYRLVIGRENDVLTALCRAASQVIHIQ